MPSKKTQKNMIVSKKRKKKNLYNSKIISEDKRKFPEIQNEENSTNYSNKLFKLDMASRPRN